MITTMYVMCKENRLSLMDAAKLYMAVLPS